MKESFPTPYQQPNVTEKDINWESNDTELVFSRVGHPVISEQLNRLLLEQEIARLRPFKEDEWLPHLPEGWTGEEKFKLLRNTRTGSIVDTEEFALQRAAPYPTLESMAKETEERLAEASSVTAIDYTSDTPDSDKISLEWKMPWTGERPTTKQWSIIESHEKGHLVRPYHAFLDARFRRGFDPSAVRVTPEDQAIHMRDSEQRSEPTLDAVTEKSLSEFATSYLNEYLFTACEIAERMSQLKNYFGFDADEQFTKAHLDYARAHYLEDTGVDNSMRLFFEAITPETEEAFLELINTSGI